MKRRSSSSSMSSIISDDSDIVKKKDRKPYNKNEPRISEDNPRETPSNYKSIQKYINSNGGHIDSDKLDKYLAKLKSRGFVNITDIYSILPGTRFVYITTDYKWRSGGFLISLELSNKSYDTTKLNKEYKPYILYKGFNNAVFSLQVEDIHKIYIKQKTAKQKIIQIKEPENITNFPVTAKNSNGDDEIIYYARDEFARNRYMNSKKYKKIVEDNHEWEFY